MTHTIDDSVRETEIELRATLRALRSTLDRHERADEIASTAAGFRRAHPLAFLIRGVPESLQLDDAQSIAAALARMKMASQATQEALAPIFGTRALSVEDVSSIEKVLDLDVQQRRFCKIAERLAGAPGTPRLDHPLYTQWATALSSVDALPRSRKPRPWFTSDAAGYLLLTPFFAGAVAAFIAVTTGFFSPLLPALTSASLAIPCILYGAVRGSTSSRLADWPDDLVERCLAVGATPEIKRIMAWARDGTLSHDDLSALSECISIREAMTASIYSEQPPEASDAHRTESGKAHKPSAQQTTSLDEIGRAADRGGLPGTQRHECDRAMSEVALRANYRL